LQPTVQAANYLRMMACAQIVNFCWREGATAQEAKPYFDEASSMAQAAGDKWAYALILAGYGRLLAATGSADEYVAKLREAQALAGDSSDSGLRAILNAILCHALRLSGRMSDALPVNIEAMDHVGEISQFGRQMIGFDIEPWLIAMRGQTLVVLGRGEEAQSFLDRVIQMDHSKVDVTNYVIPSLAYVDLAWAWHDPQMAEHHAARAFSLAVKSGNPYLRVYAQAARGVSHAIARRYQAAVEDLTSALAIARQRKAGLENEARMLADLADAYRLNGEMDAALAISTEAINVAMARNARVAECFARIVHGEALRASKNADSAAAAADELRLADALLQETGAVIYAPLIHAAKKNPVEAADAPRKSVGAG
jgi:tetratricopeptide (TPR) repeat protein